MKHFDSVESNGELARKSHEDKEHVEKQEGSPVLTSHHLFEAVLPRHGQVRLAVKVDDGQQLVQAVGVGRAESFHHLQCLLLVGLNQDSDTFSFPSSEQHIYIKLVRLFEPVASIRARARVKLLALKIITNGNEFVPSSSSLLEVPIRRV